MDKIYMVKEGYLVDVDEDACNIIMVTKSFKVMKGFMKHRIESGRIKFDFKNIECWNNHYKKQCDLYEISNRETNNHGGRELVQRHIDNEARKEFSCLDDPCTKEEYERMKSFKAVNSLDELFDIEDENDFITMLHCGLRGAIVAIVDVVEDGKEICIKIN